MAQKIQLYRIPTFEFEFAPKEKERKLTLFELSSHARVRSALELGLSIQDLEFNIFVIGENRTGRMNATLEYVKSYLDNCPAPSDWVYVNNFTVPNRPKPFKLPSGSATDLQLRLKNTMGQLRKLLTQTFASSQFQTQLKQCQHKMELSIKNAMEGLKLSAQRNGFELQQQEDGAIHIVRLLGKNKRPMDQLTAKQKEAIDQRIIEIKNQLAVINEDATHMTEKTFMAMVHLKQQVATQIWQPLFNDLEKSFSHLPEIIQWLQEIQQDLLAHLDRFMPRTNDGLEDDDSLIPFNFQTRYAVTILASHQGQKNPKVVVESNPTYENLFGTINYQTQESGGFTTDFTMIKSGSLHKANGGVLVIRAEDISQHPQVWNSLKAALRDKEIRINELQRVNGVPLWEALDPDPIPLDIKIIIIGAPHWYYTFFFNDTDFQTYFKIKADIDRLFPATPRNLSIYGTLLRQECQLATGYLADKEAIGYVLGYCARLANHRQKLSTQFEVFGDILKEAAKYASTAQTKTIQIEHVKRAIDAQAYRNMRAQDQLLQYLNDGMTLIKTQGKVLGQINGLTVQTDGIDSFGAPTRITAQTYMGRHGIINIEQMVEMGGPIQQKGVLSLEGFLRGTFGQHFPPSFGASITFEQNYGDVEGDSASMAELIAIISSLSGLPIRQDIAITGSLNQMGLAQPIGGINEKIEGFYYTCKHQGLTGTQGIIIPLLNQQNICLREEIAQAVDQGTFHIWGVTHVAEALELLLDTPIGSDLFADAIDTKTIYGRVFEKLKYYDQELAKRR